MRFANAGELKNVPNATGVVLELPFETELRWLQRLLPDQEHVVVLYSPAGKTLWRMTGQQALFTLR